MQAAFAPGVEHVFYGAHALGGRRKNDDLVRAWYERLAKIFPDLEFELKRIDVVGWPWDTTVSIGRRSLLPRRRAD